MINIYIGFIIVRDGNGISVSFCFCIGIVGFYFVERWFCLFRKWVSD